MRLTTILALTLALAAARPALAQCGPPLLHEFGASDPQAGGAVGLAVATDGLTIVGASQNCDPAPSLFHGAAYLWRKVGGTWTFDAKVPGPTGVYRAFGSSVDVDGDLFVAGGWSSNFPYERAWVYRRAAGVWVQEAELLPSDPLGGGSAPPLGIGAEGDWLAVGHYRNSGSPVTNAFSGAVYVYRRQNGLWSQVVKLVPPDAQANDQVGLALDLEDGVLAFNSRVAATSPGRVHVHRLAGGQVNAEAVLAAPGPGAGKSFGHALATDGARIAVSDPSENSFAGQVGVVHVYRHEAGAWVHEAVVRPYVPSGTFAAFGHRVSIEGDDLIVGNSGLDAGARAWHFRRVGGQWLDHGYAAKPATTGFQSSAFDLEGQTFVVGSHSTSLQASQSGAVYVHDLAGAQQVCTYCTAKVNSLGCTPTLDWTGTPSASAGSGFVIRAEQLISGMNGILFYGYDSQAPVAFQGGLLCVLSPLTRTALTNSGGSGGCSGAIAFDFNAYVAAGSDPLLGVGTTVAAQVWSRDTTASFGSNVTGAIRFVIYP